MTLSKFNELKTLITECDELEKLSELQELIDDKIIAVCNTEAEIDEVESIDEDDDE